jgi:DNA-binding transcriptional LysR family regulator
VVLRRETGGGDGEVLGHDPLGWRAADGYRPEPGAPLPLLLLPPPCGVRGVAIRRMEEAGLAWREALVAPSCAALLAAAQAGLGLAPMGEAASGGLPDAGGALALPTLPPSEIVLLARASDAPGREAVRALARAVRQGLA